jgi:hypothetical protein
MRGSANLLVMSWKAVAASKVVGILKIGMLVVRMPHTVSKSVMGLPVRAMTVLSGDVLPVLLELLRLVVVF